MAKKIGVVLAGCGFKDGAEITEAISTLIAIDKRGHTYQCFAPDKPQADVVDHTQAKVVPGQRNVLTEAARIARGKILPLAKAHAKDLDAVIFPGGFGAAKNLCDYATQGAACEADPGARRLIREMHAAGKPVGAICIAPVIVARVLGADHHVELTVGDSPGTAKDLEAMGAVHVKKKVTEAHVDRKNKVVSTPAYMYDARPSEVAQGIDALVGEVCALI